MCGIVGHISNKGKCSLDEIKRACEILRHRGPDDSGQTMIVDDSVAFGHTRLSFLDLSDQGKQPMYNGKKNLCISFNGEIYNYASLREELSESYSFSNHSDTEVLLAAYEKWGLKMLDRLQGMFAIALYDCDINKIFLIRDPFGIKPLYYYRGNEELIFASELKAINSFSSFKKEMDWSSFCDYFVYRYVPSPKTIYQNTYKVKPAHYLEYDCAKNAYTETEYWTPAFKNEYENSAIIAQNTGRILQESIALHNVSDVPVGAFLSGGYDSSAIVQFLSNSGHKPNTFSIGFESWEKSEDQFAEIVAKHLDVPNDKVVANKNSLALIDKMPIVYDEPIADISIIPTYMVSQLARKKVKAVMGGEGADEIFGGYHWQKTFYQKNNPRSLKDKMKALFQSEDTVQYYAQAMSMGWFDQDELRKMLMPEFHQFIPEDVHWFYRKHFKKKLSPLQSIQYLDMKTFMSELVLVKVDRASMANSLEVRVPFLNTPLYEYVFKHQENCYYKADTTKYLLYENIKDHLPKEILNRSKQGFVGPDDYYMQKEWYRTELENSSLVRAGIIKQSYIDGLLLEEYDWRIWKILVMDKWYAEWME